MKTKLFTLGVLLACAAGCGETGLVEETDGGTSVESGASADAGDDGEIKYEAVGGDPDSGDPHGEAGYSEKTEDGVFIKEFEVEVLNAQPGKKLPVFIDGVQVGEMTTDLEGEGDLELLEAEDIYFPEGFPEVKAGSVVKVGDVIEFTLAEVIRGLSLRAVFEKDGMMGTAKFQVETKGDRVVKEFKLEITGAEAGLLLPVTLDGHEMGELDTDVEGGGKMKLGYGEDPFPEGFTDPAAGSVLKLGDLIEVTLK